MRIGLMLIIIGVGAGLVLQYFVVGFKNKKHGRDKKQISQELITLLKE